MFIYVREGRYVWLARTGAGNARRFKPVWDSPKWRVCGRCLEGMDHTRQLTLQEQFARLWTEFPKDLSVCGGCSVLGHKGCAGVPCRVCGYGEVWMRGDYAGFWGESVD